MLQTRSGAKLMGSVEYFEMLRNELKRAYGVASEARKQGFDPSDEIEVKLAKDVAARVEGIVGPPRVADLIRSLETQGMSREDIAFEIAKRIAAGELMKGNKEILIEQAVRTGLGILTEGVLVAPTEGIAKVKIKNNPDGSDYVAVYYAGPIRSAGGTAVALSLVLADIARRVCGIGDFRVTETQTKRIVEEILTYENRCVHLQYLPAEEHIVTILQHCPVCVDGEPTEDIEVSAYRNVPGIETNRVRSGVALVICDGIALKSAKLLKITKKLKLGWDWLEKIIKVKSKEDKLIIKPDLSYLEGLVAGRPVFSYPSTPGGFRLRYGRSKTNGLMARNIHPATMVLLDGFLAYGTHMKVERPGKGCVVAAHEGLEPPVVRLRDGRVMKVRTIEEAYAIKESIEEIMFLGDILTAYGDFRKSNHPLVPGGWCEEWWLKEIEAKSITPPAARDAKSMVEFSKTYGIPLHPDFTFHYHDILVEQLKELAIWLKDAHLEMDDTNLRLMRLPLPSTPASPSFPGAKKILENLLVEHRVVDNHVIIEGDIAFALLSSMGMWSDNKISMESFENAWGIDKKPLEILNTFLPIKPKAPTYIGGRMGRPEKAKERKMDGSPHLLFPTGSFKNRSVMKHYRMLKNVEGAKTINIEVARLRCHKCNRVTLYRRCEICQGRALSERICQKCGHVVSGDIHCDTKTNPYDRRPIDIVALMDDVKSRLGTAPEDIKGVKGLFSSIRIPERLEKGFLRAKHDVYVFTDGTSRFDAIDVPLSHFTLAEIGLSIERAIELGYTHDHLGRPLEDEKQTCALRHQDIVLADEGATYLTRVANFLDEMLVNLYQLKPFYNIRKKDDLIGQMCVALSPHTSAGVLCRIIGFTKANVGYGHPYFHTAKRRNCFHPETRIMIESEDPSFVGKTLGEVVDSLIKSKQGKIKILNDGTKKVENDTSWQIRSILPKNLNAKYGDVSKRKIIERKIKCFLKTQPPEYWVRIVVKHPVSQAELELIVTPDHNVLCFSQDGAGLESIEAKDVRSGLHIPIDMSYYSSSTMASHQGQIGSAVVTKVEKMENSLDKKSAYCLDIETETDSIIEKNVLLENGIFTIRCDGDEDCVMLLLDCLINFSRSYLSEKRGGTMDAPLVLSIEINPKEVDDEAHEMEFVSSYPLEFYRAAEKITPPGDVKIKTVKDVLGTEAQFELPITHPGGTLDVGVTRTTYVTLDSIPDKVEAEFALHDRLRPVDQRDAAERLILSHFIPDLYGNLRAFSRQTFRCVNCNEILRRVPLAGKCNRCGGTLLLTINKGGIQKYLAISSEIVKRYALPDYLKQRLDLLEKEIKSVFEDDKSKQMGLSDFL